MTGADVRTARMALGMTIRKLAKLAAIPITAVGKYERTDHMSAPAYGKQDRLLALRTALDGARAGDHRPSRIPCARAEGAALTGAQVRAARTLLGWTGVRLSRECSIPCQTILRFERSNYLSVDKEDGSDRRGVLRAALEAAGIDFTKDASQDVIRTVDT